MIVGLPDSKEYKSQAKEWLIQSFEILHENALELEYLDDLSEPRWHFHKGKLATVLVLCHQSIESVLKSEIIEINPHFLIDLNPSNWPTLPDSKDKDFDQLFSINAEALIRVFCAICRVGTDKREIVEMAEEVRIARNKIVHSVHKDSLKSEYLVETLCRTSIIFFGTSLWDVLTEELAIHPLSVDLDHEEYVAALIGKFRFLKDYLPKRKFNKYMSLQGRHYSCPYCMDYFSNGHENTANLKPNKPDSNMVFCLLCSGKFDVKREDCKSEGCIGNVLWDNDEGTTICLTCHHETDESL